ncbi:MAG: VOC family protein [Defluviitaleaceae bacterium]|nr:VOC family protein [Defluviitaleaceae bacterium]
MPKLVPCLSFKGQCNEAIELYKVTFGAKVREKILFKDANSEDFECKVGEEDFVFYSQITIGGKRMDLADDSMGLLDETVKGKANNVSFIVEFNSDEELNDAYKLLYDEATILTPMTSTTYCTAYVVLEDKFGVCWQLMSGFAG